MRRICRVVLLALVLAGGTGVAGVSTTYADFAPVNERDAMTNTVVGATVTWASKWLAAHNVHECATTRGFVHMADDLGTFRDADGHELRYGGATIGCDVWVLTGLVADANSRDRLFVSGLCEPVVHELAHTGGMSHKDMAASGLEKLWRVDCGVFADGVDRYARIQRKQRAARAARARRHR